MYTQQFKATQVSETPLDTMHQVSIYTLGAKIPYRISEAKMNREQGC